MNRIEIKGIIPPIITPMHADESINTAELRRQVSEVRGKIKALGNVNVMPSYKNSCSTIIKK